MGREWQLPAARPLPTEQGWDAIRVVQFTFEFPPDAPPGGQLAFVRLRNGKAVGPPEWLALAADEMPGVDDLTRQLDAWAEAVLTKRGFLQDTTPARPPTAPPASPEPAMGTLG